MEAVQLIRANDGEMLFIAGSRYRILVSGQQTDGMYAIIEMNVPAGSGPSPHAHRNMEEVFYVTEGEVEFRSEKGKFIAKSGDTVRIPLGGAIHAFKNVSGNDAKLVCLVVPSGLDEMFKEVHGADPSQAKA